MLEKITPATVAGIDTSRKNEKIVSSDDTESTASVTEQALSNAISSGKITGQYGSSYLKARDTQSNISFAQERLNALKTVNARLAQLKDLAIQYTSTKNQASLEQQDSIVSQAEQALYSIDHTAATAQFMGTKVISDASTQDLGLSVINLESGDPVSQIDGAIGTVGAKMAVTYGQNAVAGDRLDNIKSANDKISEFEAQQIAKSLFLSTSVPSSNDLYSDKLNTAKVAGLI